MISVVIPLYNKEKQIANTLQTVLNQTFQDFEIVIVNDGSTDNSVAEVEKVQDLRIRIIHQKNAGVSAARNKGIEEAKYNLIAFLDADDEWKPEYLETQYNLYLKYPECSVFAVNYEFKNSKGNVTSTKINKLPFTGNDGILSNYFEVASNSHPPLWTSAVVVKKDAIESIGRFPIGIKTGEDLLTWARLAIKYKIAYNTKSHAVFIFDSTLFNQDQKDRKPEIYDFVGNELCLLYKQNNNIKGLRVYNALWHKMRCHIFLKKGMKEKAFKECLISLKYSLNIKVLIMIILCMLPYKLINIALGK